VGVGCARESRLIVALVIAGTEPALAAPRIAATEACLAADRWPTWSSDGLAAYRAARLARHPRVQTFPRTGQRGRPRRPRLVAHPRLRYGQVVKQRDAHHPSVAVRTRAVFGAPPLTAIRTVYLERQNGTLRHDNRRLTRKTRAFSKALPGLRAQLTTYQAYANLCRPHRGLARRVRQRVRGRTWRRWARRTPGMAAGITHHVWSLRELMTMKIYIND
jgi:hypothetical protein